MADLAIASWRASFCGNHVKRTVKWYMEVQEGAGSALEWCQADLAHYYKYATP